jgi:hypothetical protein
MLRAIALLLCHSFVLGAFAKAEGPELPEAPGSIAAVVTPEPAVIKPVILVQPAERKRVADKRFWTLTAYDFALTQIDIQTTVWALRNRTCKETLSAAFVGSRPSRLRLETTALAGNAGLAGLSYWLKKRGNKNWWIPQFAAGTVHAGAAAWNHVGSGCY